MQDPLTTVLSSKGQVILPKAVREQRHWGPGTRLVVENTPEGVLLKPAPLFPATRPEEVFGCLRHDGPPVSLDEMDKAVRAEIKHRHDRCRY
jgi:AbrB family looped-hinge helix DNA binding protein